MKELVRVSKLMSERGLCSRREADVYIKQGLVRVNGQVISTLGSKATFDAEIELLEKAVKEQEQKLTILLNKPVGFVSTQPEKGYRAAIELIEKENQYQDGSWQEFSPYHRKKLAVAGRLDIDSKGLLILTQDGTIARQLIGEHSEVEKEYLVRVEGKITKAAIEKLSFGLSLDGKELKKAKVTQLEENILKFILKEGKKRQIRRMCELCDLKAQGIKRVRIGKVRLGKLPEGKWRYLRKDEFF